MADSPVMDKRWPYRAWRCLPSPLRRAILWHSNAHFVRGVLALIADARYFAPGDLPAAMFPVQKAPIERVLRPDT